MSEPLVWLPFDPDLLGDVPEGLRIEEQVPVDDELPASIEDVAFYVPPYTFAKRAVRPEVFAAMPRLQVVQSLTAGVEHLRPTVPSGVTLCNARGVHDASTAELAVALTLASLRGIPDFVREAQQGIWNQTERPALADKRVMILGYGSIGHAIERRLLPFEVELVKVARTRREGVHPLESVHALLPDVDVVIVILPLTDETGGLVDAEFLGRMKDGALLVNVARGPIVDTDALLAENGRVLAALDVTDPEPLPQDHPLWSAPGVLISPHVGGATSAMWPRAYRLIREQLHRFAAGDPLANVMDGAY